MQVPAAGERVGDMRAAHEGRVITEPLTDLLDGASDQHGVVRGLEPLTAAESQLDLTRAELDFLRPDRHTERQQGAAQLRKHRLELVVANFRQVLVAVLQRRDGGRRPGLHAVLRIQIAIDQSKQVKLDLEPADESEAVPGQPVQRFAQKPSGGQSHRLAVRVIKVAKHPAVRRRPRQPAEGSRIGDHDQIRRTGETRRAHACPGLPHREHRAVRRILEYQRRDDRATVDDRIGDRAPIDGLAAREAMLVGENEADDLQAVALHRVEHIPCLREAGVVPEAEPIDETVLEREFGTHVSPPRCKRFSNLSS